MGAYYGMVQPHPDDAPEDTTAEQEYLKYQFSKLNFSSLSEPIPDDVLEITLKGDKQC